MTRKMLLDVVGAVALAAVVIAIAGPPLLAQKKETGAVPLRELTAYKELFEKHMNKSIEETASTKPRLTFMKVETWGKDTFDKKSFVIEKLAKSATLQELTRMKQEVIASIDEAIKLEGKGCERVVRDTMVEKNFATVRAFKNLAKKN